MLPQAGETIKTAIRTVVLALKASDQLTGELQAFLEEAYVSLADYIDEELATLMGDYRQASAELAAGGRRGHQQLDTPAWKIVAQGGRLAGVIARSITARTEELRNEFAELLRS